MTRALRKRTTFPRSVYANLVERYLFNFRLPPDALDSRLPVSWLKPQVFNEWGVVSFCILRLEHLTLWPLPQFLGFNTTSCAYRCGVIDTSGVVPEPAVYVIGRNTDLPIVSRLGPALFSGGMEMIHTDIAHTPDSIDIRAAYVDGRNLFSAKVRPSKTPEKLDSQLFGSLGSFIHFIKDGVSSYTPSARGNRYSRVDLEEDTSYEAVDATVGYSWLDKAWKDAGLVFDSAVRASNRGHYKWTYLGQVSAQNPDALAA